MNSYCVLIAGSTGYLGKHLIRELHKAEYYTIALARNPAPLNTEIVDKIVVSEMTQPESLKGICEDVDYVISTVGITNQQDGLLYMDVDYQANLNLLEEAIRAKVKKFIYVSVLNGPMLRNLKMIEAKERFVQKLETSGMDYLIIRPNGFFSDMAEIFKMAKKGTVYLFGNGEYIGNPIHGADLAEFIVNRMKMSRTELDIGGPEILTQNEIAESALKACSRKGKIVHIPIWVRNLSLALIRTFSSQKTYGPIEFFMTVMTMNMLAPVYGKRRLSDFFQQLANHSVK